MGKVWIKALAILHVEEHGKLAIKRPGDWAKVGKQFARAAVAAGQAEIPHPVERSVVLDLDGCGAVVHHGDMDSARGQIEQRYRGLDVVDGLARLEFERTLLWDTSAQLKMSLLPVGFHCLATGWQMAMPLLDYTTRAADIGTNGERARTKEIIRDLRVPVYDTRVIFALRCPEVRETIAQWIEERGEGDERLAFLRALYRVKPVICALPMTWLEQ